MPDQPLRVIEALAQLAWIDPESTTLQSLERACRIGVDLLPGICGLSVTATLSESDFTFAASDSLPDELDEHQYRHGGPCVEALHAGVIVESVDLGGETRWPSWTARALAAGICSIRSVPLSNPRPLPAALNFYGEAVRALADPEAQAHADAITLHISSLVANLATHEAALEMSRQLRLAMASRAEIEQAKGILMGALSIDADTAFAYLVRVSQSGRGKLREVAAETVARAIAGKLSFQTPD